ncbi:hypothetical protein AMTRI_Chr02g216600 [Amborella trichopoda]
MPNQIDGLFHHGWSPPFPSLGLILWHLSITAILWTIRKERNARYFEGTARQFDAIVVSILKTLVEWAQAHNSFKHIHKELFYSNFHSLLALKEKKFVKLNFDGSVQDEGRLASYGRLFCDCMGNTIWSYHGTLHPCTANEVKVCLSFIIEDNSLNAINWCMNPASTPWQWIHLPDRIDRCLCGKELSFIHVHRKWNGSADGIVRGVVV